MPLKDQTQLARAKAMRREPTKAEQMLWAKLRAKQLHGIKFSHQVLIGDYIADFAARQRRLVIEVDGDSHAAQQAYDQKRTEFLEGKGFRVIRFSNLDVIQNIEGVLEAIEAAL
jgi:very-short-patch-repair endonuclease